MERSMKLRLTAFLTALLLTVSSFPLMVAPAVAAENGTELKIRIVDYNICALFQPEHDTDCYGTVGDYTVANRAPRLKKLITAYSPDVIALQEVNYEWFPYLVSNSATKLTDVYGYVGTSEEGNVNGTGKKTWDLYNLIFYRKSKYTLIRSGTFWMSPTPSVANSAVGTDARVCTWAVLRDKTTGLSYLHANTHLTTAAEEYALYQAKVLCEQLEAINTSDLPIVLTGDMNVHKGGKTKAYAVFPAYGYDDARDTSPVAYKYACWRDFRGTSNSCVGTNAFTGNCIDQIFLKGSIRPLYYKMLTESFTASGEIIDEYSEILEKGDIPGYDISDHLGIYFEASVTNDVLVWDGTVPTSQPAGFVRSGNTYTVTTPEGFAWFASTVNNGTRYAGCTVKLECNIDLSHKAWKKIGGNNGTADPFQGVFDGGGHLIYNLYVNATTARSGLFGYISGATVKNLGIACGTVRSSATSTGSLVGCATTGCLIESCYSKADVVGAKGGTGGILGLSWNANTVRNCYYKGSVSSSATAASGSEISIGGIVGMLSTSNSTETHVDIHGCYYSGEALGNASGYTYKGGIYGSIAAEKESQPTSNLRVDISGCAIPGGDTAYWYSSSSVNRSYNTVSPTNVSAGFNDNISGKLNYFGGYTCDYRCLNGYFPVLKWETEQAPVLRTEGNNVYIDDAQDLFMFAYTVNTGDNYSGKTVTLTADIDLENKRFTEIGGWDGTTAYLFAGDFNGNAHTVSNLYIYSDTQRTGFFGYVGAGSKIYDFGIESGSVASSSTLTGGIAGVLTNGASVTRCFSLADVCGANSVGGLVGYARAYSSPTVITDSYCRGYVTGSSYDNALKLGGIVGNVNSDSSITYKASFVMERCYYIHAVPFNKASVTVSGKMKAAYTGALIGLNSTPSVITATVSHCGYNTSDTLVSSADGVTSNGTFSISTGEACVSADKLNSGADSYVSDFAEPMNGGYPILKWQRASESAYLVGVAATVDDEKMFISNLPFGDASFDGYVEVVGNGTLQYSDSEFATGAKVSVVTRGETVKTYETVVSGDTDGDGALTVNDYIMVKMQLCGVLSLEGAYLEAANVDGTEGITSTDYLRIKVRLMNGE